MAQRRRSPSAATNRSIALDGAKLAAARKAKGLTQEALARESLSLSTITRAERGKRIFTETAAFLADELGVRLEELLAGDGTTKNVASTLPRARIAVLPFQRDDTDAGHVDLARGIALDLVTRLSRWWFPVVDPTSTIRLEALGTPTDTQLGARYLVRGEVLRVGNTVRVTTHLTEAETNNIIWRESDEGPLSQLFDRQHEIATKLVAAIGPKVLDAEVERYQELDPRDLDAWQQALRGEWHFYRRTSKDNRRARELLEAALKRNQYLPLAWYSLALTHQQDIVNQWTQDVRQSMAAMQAVCAEVDRLYPSESWAHIPSAYLDVYLGNRDAAMSRLTAAIERDPNTCLAYALHGQTLAMANRPDEGIEHLEVALRLSPKDTERWSIHTGLALSHFAAERYEEAIAAAQRASRIRPNIAFAYGTIASALALLGHQLEAQQILSKMVEHGMTLDGVRSLTRSTDPEIAKRYLDGLHQAGLPKS